MTHINQKLAALERIYDIYADFSAEFEAACQKHCAHCCTCHVNLTTLEGYWIISSATEDRAVDLAHRLTLESCATRFKPLLTINHIAQRCISGEDIPDESRCELPAKCPLLNETVCPIYATRPFGCRCMLSSRRCEPNGHAEMDPFVLTVNNVFLQVIEHIDVGGCTGNLTDVLQCMLVDANRQAYENRQSLCPSCGLIPNQPLKALMIPPEHRDRIQSILAALHSITV